MLQHVADNYGVRTVGGLPELLVLDVCAHTCQLPVGAASVDVILSFNALHYMSTTGWQSMAQVSAEAARVLKPHGTALAVWNFAFNLERVLRTITRSETENSTSTPATTPSHTILHGVRGKFGGHPINACLSISRVNPGRVLFFMWRGMRWNNHVPLQCCMGAQRNVLAALGGSCLVGATPKVVPRCHTLSMLSRWMDTFTTTDSVYSYGRPYGRRLLIWYQLKRL